MIFETSRLLVRQLTRDDLEEFYQFNSNEQVMRYIRPPQDWDQAYDFLQQNIQYYQGFPQFGRWAVIEKTSSRFIGSFMLKPSEKLEGSVEIGYAFFSEYWGRGFAVEVLTGGLQYAFERLLIASVVAITHPDNVASQKVLLKCGFERMSDYAEEKNVLRRFTRINASLLETDRLVLVPLSVPQLALYLEGGDKFEKQWALGQNQRTVSPQVSDMVNLIALPKMKRSKLDNYLFHTFWLVIEKSSRQIVAELGFKGPPDKSGEIEIGYGTMPSRRGQGFMTEAVGAIIQWARSRPEVYFILAETEENNRASIRVVEKNRFQPFFKKGHMLWWKIAVK